MPRFFAGHKGDFCQSGAGYKKLNRFFRWMGPFLYVYLQVGSQDMPSELFFLFKK